MKWKIITCPVLALCILMMFATVVAADNTDITGSVTVIIYDTSTSNIGYYSATISWKTNNPADSQVEYGTTTGYGLTTSLSADPVTSHIVQLTDLSSGTTYHFRVKSGNASGTAVSPDYTFITSTITYSGGGGEPSYDLDSELFGKAGTSPISFSGEVMHTLEGTSADDNLSITIPAGTRATQGINGPRLESLSINPYNNPPAPPAQTNIIGLSYNFEPNGAYFKPAITLTWKYDPTTVGNVLEESLALAYYDDATGKWVELECEVDTVNNTITAKVTHFTLFAMIGPLPANIATTTSVPTVTTTTPTTPITTSAIITPTSTITTASSATTTSITTITNTATTTARSPAEPINWPLIIGIIIGVILAGVLIWLVVIRKRST